MPERDLTPDEEQAPSERANGRRSDSEGGLRSVTRLPTPAPSGDAAEILDRLWWQAEHALGSLEQLLTPETHGRRNGGPVLVGGKRSSDVQRAALDRLHAKFDRLAAAVDRDHADRARRQAAADRDEAARERVMAGTDELTGALRRDPGLVELRHQMDRCERTTRRLVVGFLDVDGLKAVNDTRGHAAGDRLLQHVVAQLRSCLRSYETVVRFGGDEFLFTLADVDVDTARRRVDEFCDRLTQINDTYVSVGLASWRAGDSVERLIARADSDLYRGRRERRSHA